MTERDDASGSPAGLAEKLDALFNTVVDGRGRPFSHEDVARGIAERGGPTISATYLWQLRRGQRTNPRMSHLHALAQFFGVTPAYFFSDELAERMAADVEAAARFRDPAMRALAESARGLTDPTLVVVLDLLERLQQLEGAQPAST